MKTLAARISRALGHDPAAPHRATYVELSRSSSRCSFFTPARGSRDWIVRLSVDEIEDLILAADAAKDGPNV